MCAFLRTFLVSLGLTLAIQPVLAFDNDFDYFMRTLQGYTTAYHPFNEHMVWDLGVYVGQVEEQQNISLNLDDPIDDPGDGGAISFQSVF